MISTTDISKLTFKKVEGRDLSKFKDDLQMFNLLSAMDGKRSISTIAQEDFYDVAFLSEKVNELVQMGILEPVHGGGTSITVAPDAMQYLLSELTKQVGPVAGMLLKDAAAKLGHDITRFPSGMIGELIDSVSTFIQNQSKAVDFKRTIMTRLS